MKPAPFAYVQAESIEHAVQALSKAGGDGKIIAGGQSLMPMMNFRLVKPAVLVDINRIPGLDSLTCEADRIRIGALVRHRMTATDPLIAEHLPVVHHAMKHVAHLTVRNRGTFCGSVCHADPAAEMPMLALLLNGTAEAVSVRGSRSLSMQDFFVGALATSLAADELVTAIEIDRLRPGTGWGFEEFARRHGDYALVAVAVTVERRQDRAAAVRIGAIGVGELPARVGNVETLLEDSDMGAAALTEAVDLLQASISPGSDLNASADYRRHLAGVLLRRAMTDAWARARELGPI